MRMLEARYFAAYRNLTQVALSLILPVPMITLLILTRHRDVMGSCASGSFAGAAVGGAAIVPALNLLLVLQIAGVVPPAFAAAG
jgi:manganese transport protein